MDEASGQSETERLIRRADWVEELDPVDLHDLATKLESSTGSGARQGWTRGIAVVAATAAAIAAAVGVAWLVPDRDMPNTAPSEAPDGVPWIDDRPKQASAASVAECAPDRLEFRVGRVGAWHDQATQQIEIRNLSSETCAVTSAMTASVQTDQGKTVPVSFDALSERPVPVGAGETAFLTFGAPASCGEPKETARSLDIQTGEGAAVRLDRVWVPVNCGEPAAMDLYADPAEPPTQDVALSARIKAPLAVVAGSTLVFQVTLTNTSSDRVDFKDCPTYMITLKPGDGQRYVLNCRSDPSLAPEESRTYDMESQIPEDGARSVQLTWALDGYPAVASVPLSVSPGES